MVGVYGNMNCSNPECDENLLLGLLENANSCLEIHIKDSLVDHDIDFPTEDDLDLVDWGKIPEGWEYGEVFSFPVFVRCSCGTLNHFGMGVEWASVKKVLQQLGGRDSILEDDVTPDK